MNPLTQAVTTAAALKVIDKDRKEKEQVSESKPTNIKEAIVQRPFTWLVVIGVVGYVGYRVVKKVLKPGPPSAESMQKKDVSKLETLFKPSYNEAAYAGYADAIYAAGHANNLFGTDEDAIYRVLGLMKNDLDFAKLSKAFGKRRLFASFYQGDLIAFLNDELNEDDGEIEKANSILARNGITYVI